MIGFTGFFVCLFGLFFSSSFFCFLERVFASMWLNLPPDVIAFNMNTEDQEVISLI